jgi:hypothetical protein
LQYFKKKHFLVQVKVLETFLVLRKVTTCFVLEDQAGSHEVVVCTTKLLPVITHHPVEAE